MKRDKIIKLINSLILIVVLVSLFLYYGGIVGISQSMKQGENQIQAEAPSLSIYENRTGTYLNVTNNFDEPIAVTVEKDTAVVQPHGFAMLELNRYILESKLLPLQIKYLNSTLCFNISL